MFYKRIVAEISMDNKQVQWRVARGRIDPTTPNTKAYLQDGSEVVIWWKNGLPKPNIRIAAQKRIVAKIEEFEESSKKRRRREMGID